MGEREHFQLKANPWRQEMFSHVLLYTVYSIQLNSNIYVFMRIFTAHHTRHETRRFMNSIHVVTQSRNIHVTLLQIARVLLYRNLHGHGIGINFDKTRYVKFDHFAVKSSPKYETTTVNFKSTHISQHV